MRAETLLTLEIHQVEELPRDEYCRKCGDDGETAYRWTFEVDDLEGLQHFEMDYCTECLADFVRTNYPWASYMVRDL